MYKTRRKANTFRVPVKVPPDLATANPNDKNGESELKEENGSNSNNVTDNVTASVSGPTGGTGSLPHMGKPLQKPRYNTANTSGSVPSDSEDSDQNGSQYIEVITMKQPSTPYSELVESVAPRSQSSEHNYSSEREDGAPRAKRIHLDTEDCMRHVISGEGGKALCHPNQVQKSSKDPNRGLYPRPMKLKNPPSRSSSAFVKASEMSLELPASYQAKLAEESKPEPEFSYDNKPVSQSSFTTQGGQMWNSERRRKTKLVSSQSNKIQSYFLSGTEKGSTSSSPAKNYMDWGDEDDDVIIISDTAKIPVTSHTSTVASVENPQHKTQYTVALPDLPSIIPLSPTASPRKADRKGTKRRVTSKTKTKNAGKIIGPEIHSLRKASFLYDTELAKPTAGLGSVPSLKDKQSPDTYGLLGSGNYPHTQGKDIGSPFYSLPYELIENIFCRLPMMDLYLNVNRVCVGWKNIISASEFLPWKKKYHRFKAAIHEDEEFMKALLIQNGMTSLETFLPQLIRYMKDHKRVTAPNMDSCLQEHRKYEYAKALLEERFPECFGLNKVPNPWCMITALVIVSEFVSDIKEIYNALLSAVSQCTAYEVIECLYCLATFLLKFTNSHMSGPWNGMHYRLYYALYLLENESTTTTDQLHDAASHGRGGQQSLMKYATGSTVQMTHEQLRICNHNVQPGDIVKIVAFAGTGKTTTLVKYTQLRPNLRFLLVVYNKSVQQHAETKFPKNVTCKTGHSLAFKHVGWKYNKVGKIGFSLKVTNIMNHFEASKGESLYVQAKFIIITLNNFMASADGFITTAHVPEESVDDNGVRKPISHQLRMHYAAEAEKIWQKMIDLNNPHIKITHDTYLKLYHLSNPLIYNYDIILIDEAQDMTPALSAVLLAQRQAKILVGDPHQQIYAFRGAVNAMQQLEDSHTFYLTQSFRFGSEISFVAASCLSLLKGEKKKTLVGNASNGSVRGGIEGQLAVITRSNFTLFNEAVTKCCYSDSPNRVAFVGGTKSFGFDMILDIYALLSSVDGKRDEIKNNFIANFSSLGELEKYAVKTMDTELLGKIKIVKTYHHSLPSLINKILTKCINDTDIADIVLSTAHKAKGLEFSTVRLTDDFVLDMGAVLGREAASQSLIDESNLLYVAATRAKKQLILTNTLKALLTRVGERFRYPVLTKKLTAEGAVMECECTGASFDPCALTLVQRAVSLSERVSEEKDVFYSPETVYREMSALRNLYGRKGEEEPDDLIEMDDAEDMMMMMM